MSRVDFAVDIGMGVARQSRDFFAAYIGDSLSERKISLGSHFMTTRRMVDASALVETLELRHRRGLGGGRIVEIMLRIPTSTILVPNAHRQTAARTDTGLPVIAPTQGSDRHGYEWRPRIYSCLIENTTGICSPRFWLYAPASTRRQCKTRPQSTSPPSRATTIRLSLPPKITSTAPNNENLPVPSETPRNVVREENVFGRGGKNGTVSLLGNWESALLNEGLCYQTRVLVSSSFRAYVPSTFR
ncbi:hypothetical protein EDD18DRAFT_1110016 [Armillaria luteobubalina]|uniref:Uncharacterized protein n=1 Tax=Armillaria luteobubalina TaxID=153913 RepID=A0AA39PSD9_9AGAR|nr:hypothetical protein EDD18DRAFT_1110016 [Armillaria luteobubalina]